jgi:hypothetical protein
MMHFGFSNQIDLLSWLVVLTLGAKLIATLVLLAVGKENRDRPGWGATLWWITKIAPAIAVPCMILLAWLQGMTNQIWLFLGLMLFVVLAVPLKVHQRQMRIVSETDAI